MAKKRKLKNVVISGVTVTAAGIGLAAILMVGSGSKILWIVIGVCGTWITLFLLANADETGTGAATQPRKRGKV